MYFFSIAKMNRSVTPKGVGLNYRPNVVVARYVCIGFDFNSKIAKAFRVPWISRPRCHSLRLENHVGRVVFGCIEVRRGFTQLKLVFFFPSPGVEKTTFKPKKTCVCVCYPSEREKRNALSSCFAIHAPDASRRSCIPPPG